MNSLKVHPLPYKCAVSIVIPKSLFIFFIYLKLSINSLKEYLAIFSNKHFIEEGILGKGIYYYWIVYILAGKCIFK